MARSTSPASERDRRSLRVQIDEDDDVIEIEAGGTTDHGAGMTNCLRTEVNQPVGFSPGPGKGRGSVAPACRATDDPDNELNDETKIPNESTDEESVPHTLLQHVHAWLQERVRVLDILLLHRTFVSPVLTKLLLHRYAVVSPDLTSYCSIALRARQHIIDSSMMTVVRPQERSSGR